MKKLLPIYLLFIFFLGCVSMGGNHPDTGVFLPSQDEEVGFGQYVDAQIRSKNLVLDDPLLHQKINNIGQDIAAVSDRPELPFVFVILNDNEINAFAAPFKYVYVTTGLLNFINNKDELAGVLAHEIGHIVARHGVKQYRNEVLAERGLTLAQIALIFSGLPFPDLIGIGTTYGAIGALQKLTRGFESQADFLGTVYMYKAGFDPNGILSFLQRLWEEKEKKRKSDIVEAFFRSHPQTPERIENVKKILAAINFKNQEKPIEKKGEKNE